MLTKADKRFTILFIFLLLAELFCGNIDTLATWRYFTKPSLVIALTLYFYFNSKKIPSKIRNMTLLALIFSLMGDVLLMFVNQPSNFFTLGLVAFFMAHVFYILIFWTQKNSKINPTVVIIILAVYAIGLFYLLIDRLGALFFPVIGYILVILTMAVAAYLRDRKVSKISFIFVFLGAILFIISDSILALNKFYVPLKLSSVSIMITYALAQYFIVFGLLKSR